MRGTFGLGRLAPFLLAVGLAGCLKQKVELQLTLPKTKWEVGESLWYRLEIKNVGWKTVEIDDPFWFFQRRILENQKRNHGTYVFVADSSGQVVRPSTIKFGMHGEFDFWTNDCGDGVPCEKTGFRPVRLRRGESLVATPSMESAVRPQGETLEITDARMCPDANAAKEQCEGWRRSVESFFLNGDPRRISIAGESKNAKGYRILDTVVLSGPGRYRIKAQMDARDGLPVLSADEEISLPGWCEGERREVCALLAERVRSDWKMKSPEDLAELRRFRVEVENANRSLPHAESNSVDFEVVEASAPGPGSGTPRLENLRRGPRFGAALRAAEGQ